MNHTTPFALLLLISSSLITGCVPGMNGRGSAFPAGGGHAAPGTAGLPTDATVPTRSFDVPSTAAATSLPVEAPTRQLPARALSPRLQPHMQCWVCR